MFLVIIISHWLLLSGSCCYFFLLCVSSRSYSIHVNANADHQSTFHGLPVLQKRKTSQCPHHFPLASALCCCHFLLPQKGKCVIMFPPWCPNLHHYTCVTTEIGSQGLDDAYRLWVVICMGTVLQEYSARLDER